MSQTKEQSWAASNHIIHAEYCSVCATLTTERDRLRIKLGNARQHAKGIVQGASSLEIAEAILGEHEDNRPRGASGERLDSELCRVCALASLIKQGERERDALRTALRKYGQHRASCHEMQPIPLGSDVFCDCGFGRALGGKS